jgi:hypothetical protein
MTHSGRFGRQIIGGKVKAALTMGALGSIFRHGIGAFLER